MGSSTPPNNQGSHLDCVGLCRPFCLRIVTIPEGEPIDSVKGALLSFAPYG
jgi:hypothetical protein